MVFKRWDLEYKTKQGGLHTFSVNGPDGKYFRLCGKDPACNCREKAATGSRQMNEPGCYN